MATAIFDTEPYLNLECLLIITTVIYPDSSWLDRLRVQCVCATIAMVEHRGSFMVEAV